MLAPCAVPCVLPLKGSKGNSEFFYCPEGFAPGPDAEPCAALLACSALFRVALLFCSLNRLSELVADVLFGAEL